MAGVGVEAGLQRNTHHDKNRLLGRNLTKTNRKNRPHAGREAGQAAGTSGVAKVFSRTNEKRATIMVARIDCLLLLTD